MLSIYLITIQEANHNWQCKCVSQAYLDNNANDNSLSELCFSSGKYIHSIKVLASKLQSKVQISRNCIVLKSLHTT